MQKYTRNVKKLKTAKRRFHPKGEGCRDQRWFLTAVIEKGCRRPDQENAARKINNGGQYLSKSEKNDLSQRC